MKPNPQLSQREQAQLSTFVRRRVNHLSPSVLDRVIDGAKEPDVIGSRNAEDAAGAMMADADHDGHG